MHNYGNFLELIKKILVEKYNITEENNFVSNYIDEAKWEYELNNKKLEVFLIEDLLEDKTIIRSSDKQLCQELIEGIKLVGGIEYESSI